MPLTIEVSRWRHEIAYNGDVAARDLRVLGQFPWRSRQAHNARHGRRAVPTAGAPAAASTGSGSTKPYRGEPVW